MKIDNIKEEVTHDMEKLRKRNETEIKNKMEGTLQQTRKSRRQNLRTFRRNGNIKEKLKNY
jgi:hypothetical protein